MPLFVEYPKWLSPYVIKGLPIRWYAVMYIFAFVTAFILYRRAIRTERGLEVRKEDAENLFFWTCLGLLVGARVWSCFFYDDAAYYLAHPWMIFWPFRNGRFVGLPGMSYHGGVVGGILAALIYARKKKMPVLKMFDLIASSIPFAYTWGRLGNFFNAELYGKVTSSPLGMLFPDAELFPSSLPWAAEIAGKCGIDASSGYVNLPRWPSQLFEAFFEGIVLGLIVWFVVRKLKAKRNWADGVVFSSYLMGYAVIRFILEYFRQPDSSIGYVFTKGGTGNIYIFDGLLSISKGQVFSAIMLLLGIAALAFSIAYSKRNGKNDRRKGGSLKKGDKKGRR